VTAAPVAGRDLVRTFNRGTIVAVADVDFTVHPGEMVALMGPSGSGKTTLLNLLGLLDRPDEGEVWIDGIPVADAGERELRRMRAARLGFVFQDALLDMRRTAHENVMLGLRYAAVDRRRRAGLADEALAITDTAHRAHAFAATLSGGERQRVAIARAIAHRPAALLCDEPTGALDDGNTQRVVALLSDLARESTAVIVATHDTAVARSCHRTARLVSGRMHWERP
jgi:putative ABC transport system ATP-binding protein